MLQGPKKQLFAKRQEGARKDVDRAFGVLQSRFAIVRGPSRFWHVDTMKSIMDACIILHNMIVEDERDGYLHTHDYEQFNSEVLSDDVTNGPSAAYAPAFAPAFTTYCENRRNMR